MKLILLLACTGLLAPLPALAGDCGGPRDALAVVAHIFEKADSDADGLLTPAEYEAAGLERFGIAFEDSDLDSDGVTSLDEYTTLYEMHHPSPDGSEA